MSYRYSNIKIAGFTKQVRTKEVELTFARTSGPGGQNMQKNDTKVQLYWKVKESKIIPQPYLQRLIERNEKYLSQEGILRIDTGVHRSQKANKEQTYKKLQKIIKSAFKEKTPRKTTNAPKRAVDKRIAEKRKRSKTRSTRKKIVG